MHEVLELPPIDEYKANFDEAISKSGRRWFFSDSRCLVLTSKVVLHSNVGSAFTVEALACTNTVKMYLDLGTEVVTIEGDSHIVIKKCKLTLTDRSKISPYI